MAMSAVYALMIAEGQDTQNRAEDVQQTG